MQKKSQQALTKLCLGLCGLGAACLKILRRHAGTFFAEHRLGIDNRTHLIAGFDQGGICPAETHTKLRIEQGRDQSSLQRLRLIALALLDQFRSLTHPLFGLGPLQIFDALNQSKNSQRSLFIAHALLKISDQALSPLRQLLLLHGERGFLLVRLILDRTPSQGRLNLRQHAGFPRVNFLSRINRSEQDEAPQFPGGCINGSGCG